MKIFRQIILLGALGLLVMSCATSGPKYSEMADSIPPLSGDNGRLYIYRITAFGATVQPSVYLDGEVVGKAVPKGFFHVDCPPGIHRIATTTEVERELTFHLDEGESAAEANSRVGDLRRERVPDAVHMSGSARGRCSSLAARGSPRSERLGAWTTRAPARTGAGARARSSAIDG